MKRFLKWVKNFLAALLLISGTVWCIGVAKWTWEFNTWQLILWSAALVFMLGYSCACRRAGILLLLLELFVMSSFILLTPERQFSGSKWNPECAKIARIDHLADGKIGIANVRSFKYRSVEDFDIRYSYMLCDVNELESMDIAFSYWDEMEFAAHMLLCFNFKDGKKLAVSFEPRVTEGKRGGDFFLGIYRRYGQMMLLSTPEDIFDLRTIYRGETLYCYRTVAKGVLLRKMFMRIIEYADHLSKNAEFYNSLTKNCTTGLLRALNEEKSLRGWDVRKLFNGYYDKYLFERGFLACRRGESFGSLKARSYIPGTSRGRE